MYRTTKRLRTESNDNNTEKKQKMSSTGLVNDQAMTKSTQKNVSMRSMICSLCDVVSTSTACHITHCAGKQHCKKYLIKQNELGFEKFRERYGDLDYCKTDPSEPAPEVQDDYVIHTYHSAVFNKLYCRGCCKRMYTYRAWYDHTLSREHGEQMIDLLERHGGEGYMVMFGDLPGPNPNLFDCSENSYNCNEETDNVTSLNTDTSTTTGQSSNQNDEVTSSTNCYELSHPTDDYSNGYWVPSYSEMSACDPRLMSTAYHSNRQQMSQQLHHCNDNQHSSYNNTNLMDKKFVDPRLKSTSSHTVCNGKLKSNISDQSAATVHWYSFHKTS